MTRKKVTLAYITNDSERKASFKKRKKGLIKKVSELSTLCGVEACAIIYSQYDAEPEVWPSPAGAQAVLARFRRLSEMDQCRKMVNQESFTRQRIKKAEDQFRRVAKENKRSDMENFLYQSLAGMVALDDFDLRDAPEMSWVISQTLRDISSRMSEMKNSGRHLIQGSGSGSGSGSAPAVAESFAAAGALVAVAPPTVEMVAPPPLPPPPPPPPPPQPAAAAPVVDLPPLPAVEALPLPGSEYVMESFPWNLLESPSREGLYYSWDDGMVLPPYDQYNFNFDADTNFGSTSSSAFALPEPGTGPDDHANI